MYCSVLVTVHYERKYIYLAGWNTSLTLIWKHNGALELMLLISISERENPVQINLLDPQECVAAWPFTGNFVPFVVRYLLLRPVSVQHVAMCKWLNTYCNCCCESRVVEIFLDMSVIWTDFKNLVSPNNKICSRNNIFLSVQMKFCQ